MLKFGPSFSRDGDYILSDIVLEVKNKHEMAKKPKQVSAPKEGGGISHVYRLELNSDGTYKILIDGKRV